MDEEKRKNLEAKGWKVGDASELLGLSKTYEHWIDDPACHDALCSYRAESGIPEASSEYQRLLAELYDLKNAITKIVTQRLDDICWRDIYTELAGLVGVEFDPDLLPRDQMLANCERFIDSVKNKTEYTPVYFSNEECTITEEELKNK